MIREYTITDSEYNKLLAHIDRFMREQREELKLIKALIKGLNDYEGKVINKRIEDHCKKAIPDGYSAHYYKRYNWYHINIYNKATHARYDISLADRQKASKDSHMQRLDLKYLKDRAADLEKKIQNSIEKLPDVTETITKFNTALTWLKKAEQDLTELPGWYSYNRYH